MEDYYEHIGDYMNGTLGAEQRAAFEAEMERNASLQKAVDNYEAAKALSEGLLEVDMLETLQELKNESSAHLGEQKKIDRSSSGGQVIDMESTTKANRFSRRWWMTAAVFLGVLAVATWWMTKPLSDGLDQKYVLENYNRPYDEDATKSVDTVGMTPFQKGKYMFGLNEFEESIKWMEQYLSEIEEKKLRSEGYFWLGAAYLELWQLEKARESWGKSSEEGVAENLELIE